VSFFQVGDGQLCIVFDGVEGLVAEELFDVVHAGAGTEHLCCASTPVEVFPGALACGVRAAVLVVGVPGVGHKPAPADRAFAFAVVFLGGSRSHLRPSFRRGRLAVTSCHVEAMSGQRRMPHRRSTGSEPVDQSPEPLVMRNPCAV